MANVKYTLDFLERKYKEYEAECNDKKHLNEYITKKTASLEYNLNLKTKCIYISLFGILNIIISIMFLTIFKVDKFFSTLLYTYLIIIFSVIPLILILEVASYIVDKLTEKDKTNIENIKENLKSNYQKLIYEKYETYINEYNREKNKPKVRNFNNQEILNKYVIKILENKNYKILKTMNKNNFVCSFNNDKVLVISRVLKRTITIGDISKIKEIIKDKYDYCIIYYVGNISTRAVQKCSRLKRNPIYLYNKQDIEEYVYKYSLR